MSNPFFDRTHDQNDLHNLSDPADLALREGLRGLPVPPVSADFDARVLAGLRKPLPWWLLAWHLVRPALTAAACSLVITFAFVQWARAATPPLPRAAANSSASAALENVDLLDAIDQPVVHAAFLTTLAQPRSYPEPSAHYEWRHEPQTEGPRIVNGVVKDVVKSGNGWTPRSS